MTTVQDKLARLVKYRSMGPYIEYIRFPFYKNLKADTRIEFTYPITALVGPNGTNKSSVLRAIMGCPEGSNLGNFWFATKLDPIVDDENNRPAFIHGHYNHHEGRVVEVLKLRISKESDPGYWEPSRPIRRYGMERMPAMPPSVEKLPGRTKTRWNPVVKDVIYLDFRSMLSAFDKFFYHGDMSRRMASQLHRRDLIVSRAPHLKTVVEGNLKNYDFHKLQRVYENVELASSTVEIISRVLGKRYQSIRLIEHSFFNAIGYSAILGTPARRYSEAVAGSGEFAVVMTVYQLVEKAKRESLILMDEPEVSLHPGAQERLVEFLTDQVNSNHHQIIISTHSPGIVRMLPSHAIKVFAELPSGEVFVPTQASSHAEAFFNLGEPIKDVKTVVVEDKLAAEIVRKVLRSAGPAYSLKFNVIFYPGGAGSLWKRFVPVFSAERRSDVTVIFDADQRPGSSIPVPSSIPDADNDQLGQIIRTFSGCEVDFPIDGGLQGGNAQQLVEVQRHFIGWAHKHVKFLPGKKSPEEFLLSKLPEYSSQPDEAAKVACARLASESLGLAVGERPSADDILFWQRTALARIPDEDSDLAAIRGLLNTLII